MEPVITAAGHVDDGSGSPAVSAVAAAETTAAEAPAAAAEAPATEAARMTTAPTRVAPAETATAGMAPAEAARVSTAEAPAAEVAPAETAAAEMAASAPTPEVAAEGRRVGRREHADRSRDGGGSEHGLECFADHGNLQYIAEQPVCFGD